MRRTYKPRLSIGLPVYNGENFISEALDSLLAQTYEDYELIISDNASTDNTYEICQDYAKHDPRIRLARNPKNKGAAYNFNQVFELSSGEYFKWAAHDDLCAPKYIENCIEVLDNLPDVVVCYARTVIINELGTTIGYYADKSHFISPNTCKRFNSYIKVYRYPRQCHPIFGIIRADILAQTKLIQNFVGSDRILLGALVLLGRFYEIPDYLFYSRFHSNSSVRAFPEHRDRSVWFDPRLHGKLQMLRWIYFREYLQTIIESPLKWTEKVRCICIMGNWVFFNFRGLSKDLLKGIFWPVIRPYYIHQINQKNNENNNN